MYHTDLHDRKLHSIQKNSMAMISMRKSVDHSTNGTFTKDEILPWITAK
jgi:hypothetical protein